MVSCSVVVCSLLLPLVLGGLLGGDIDQNDWEENLEARLLAKLLGRKRSSTDGVPEDSGESKVKTINIDMDKKLVQKRLTDCNKSQEIIVADDNDTGNVREACYLHKMDNEFYQTVCQGKGEKVEQPFYVTEEVKDKDFLSEDGPDSVCRYRPMYLITPAEEQKEDNGCVSNMLEDLQLLTHQQRQIQVILNHTRIKAGQKFTFKDKQE